MCKIHLIIIIVLLERYRGKNPERDIIEMEADDAGWKI